MPFEVSAAILAGMSAVSIVGLILGVRWIVRSSQSR
jgi:hypothetical protein